VNPGYDLGIVPRISIYLGLRRELKPIHFSYRRPFSYLTSGSIGISIPVDFARHSLLSTVLRACDDFGIPSFTKEGLVLTATYSLIAASQTIDSFKLRLRELQGLKLIDNLGRFGYCPR
jgi:hypothetical protein